MKYLISPDAIHILRNFPYLGLFIFLILGGIGFPFPEDAVLIICGFLMSTNVISPVPAVVVVYSGLMIADFSLFLIGRRYGRRLIHHERFRKVISAEKVSLLEEKFKRIGALLIVLGRHVIGLRTQIFLVAGLMGMPALKFIIVDGITSLITMIIMIGVGYAGGHSIEVIRRDISRIEHFAVVISVLVVTILFIFIYFNWRRKKDFP